jgi:pimeloyl-ACP methyl ester carboxylesterase
MPLLRINGDDPWEKQEGSIASALRSVAPGAPVIALIHGYSYAPGVPDRCPHNHILSLHPRPGARAMSWPRHLGFGRGDAEEGLCLCFGWRADGTIWQAHAQAERAGRALARAISAVRSVHRVPVHMVGHSLGARVALAAFGDLPAGALGRAILLAGADTRATAEAALASPAGTAAEVVNILSRDNRVFDVIFRTAVHPHRPLARTLGAGLGRDDPRWLDLSLDEEGMTSLAALGFRIAPPARAICHWSAYLRPGLFPLYRALLRDNLPLRALRPASPEESHRDTGGLEGLPA